MLTAFALGATGRVVLPIDTEIGNQHTKKKNVVSKLFFLRSSECIYEVLYIFKINKSPVRVFADCHQSAGPPALRNTPANTVGPHKTKMFHCVHTSREPPRRRANYTLQHLPTLIDRHTVN